MPAYKGYEEFIEKFQNRTATEEEKQQIRDSVLSACATEQDRLTASILQGQYRMSLSLLNRIIPLRKNAKGNGRKRQYKITKSELCLLLLLLQMCDSGNRIQGYEYAKDIAPLRDASGNHLFPKSTYYHAINGLVKKGLVTVSEQLDGASMLCIPANEIREKDRYIPLQTEYLLHDSKQYLKFREMTLASMKIYLYSMAQTYHGKDPAGKSLLGGTSALTVAELKDKLGVSRNRTVKKYIRHLENAFGKITFLPGRGRKTFSGGTVQLTNSLNNCCFAKRTGLSPSQISSFRRHFDRAVARYGLAAGICQENYGRIRNYIYMLLKGKSGFSPEIGPEELFSFALARYRISGRVDLLTTADIINQLATI